MHKLYQIFVMLSITTIAHGASVEPEHTKKPDEHTQKKQPSSQTLHPTSTQKLPTTSMAATLMSATFAIDYHPPTYIPGMPGLQFSDHSPYNHHDHTLYG